MTNMTEQRVTGMVTQEKWFGEYLVSRGERAHHEHTSQQAKSTSNYEAAPTQTKLLGQWRIKQNRLYWNWTLVA